MQSFFFFFFFVSKLKTENMVTGGQSICQFTWACRNVVARAYVPAPPLHTHLWFYTLAFYSKFLFSFSSTFSAWAISRHSYVALPLPVSNMFDPAQVTRVPRGSDGVRAARTPWMTPTGSAKQEIVTKSQVTEPTDVRYFAPDRHWKKKKKSGVVFSIHGVFLNWIPRHQSPSWPPSSQWRLLNTPLSVLTLIILFITSS